MMVPAYKRESVERLAARIRTTLKRCDPPLPDSLRLTAARVVREGVLRGLQGYTEIYPSMKNFAKWGECSDRQARRNVRVMEGWGLLVPVSSIKGGKLATRYWVEPEAIIRMAINSDANPHPDLIAEIRDLRADIRADIQGGHKAGHMSAGSYDTGTVRREDKEPVRANGGRHA